MNILAKLTLRFSIIVASILVLFSLAIYIVSAEYRKEEFFDRLERRAVTTARLLVTVEEVSTDLLRIIDQNSVPALPDEKILVYDEKDSLVYNSSGGPVEPISSRQLAKIREAGKIRSTTSDFEQFGLLYRQNDEEFVVLASAYDRYGKRKLINLRTILLSGLLIGLVIIVMAGRLFAAQALAPLAKINDQVSKITAGSLDKRIDEGNKKDEIARLAINFNQMLERLETAFEMQQSFVSNASHELRTPLAIMRSQIQVTLEKDRSPDDYRQVLYSLLDDTNAFAELTTGLLTLAQSGMDRQRILFAPLRIDEIFFQAQEELAKRKPNYHFQFDYDQLPENENELIIIGSEQLLHAAFTNLMDNACKFSKDNTVYISLLARNKQLEIRFRDNGIGIPKEELKKIFSPFYRAANAQNIAKGHGIGLSLCQKIVRLHGGTIEVNSTVGKGSLFILQFPIS